MSLSIYIKSAKMEDVYRLASYLRLKINGMSERQVRRLVIWRLNRGITQRY